jgi:nitroreductase
MKFAPMAGDNFSLKFVLVDDKEIIKKLADLSEQDFISKTDYVVVVCSDGNRTENLFKDRAKKYLRQQAGAAIQNFLLKLTEVGLATTWVGHFYDDKIKRLLKIPEEIEVEALFPIGYANEKPKMKLKRDLDNFLYFNKYGNKKMQLPVKQDV